MPAIPPPAVQSLMSALCFLRIASEYVKDVTRQVNASEYRLLKLDKPTLLIRDAFNHLIAPVSAEDQRKLQKELEAYSEVQAVIAQAILLNPENLQKLQAYGDDLLKTQS